MIEVMSEDNLKKCIGGTNWGQVGGSCASGAILGSAFGNPLLGCLNGATGSILSQEATSHFKKKRHR